MPALLFFDIDGTLLTLDDKHILPDSTKDALYKAKENGHKIFINTGRVKTAIDKKLLDFGFDGMVCGCGTYIEYAGKEIFHNKISKEQCMVYASFLHQYKFQTIFEEKERLFIDGDRGPGGFLEYIYSYFSKNSEVPIEEMTHPDFIFDKFTTAYFSERDAEALRKTFSEKFNLIPHLGNVCEAVPKGFSKATGIRRLADFLEADISDCYAFGDSINDMEMLQYVPHSVAMGNSVEEVFSVVEYKTADIRENGIQKALLHYNLI